MQRDYMIGDVVSFNGHNYVIYKMEYNRCLGFKIDFYDPEIKIDFDNISVRPVFGSKMNESVRKVRFVGQLDDYFREWIIKEHKRYNAIQAEKINHPERYKTMDAGWLISGKGYQYYVYEADSNYARVIPIYFSGVSHPKAIKINGLYYKPDYRHIMDVDYVNNKYSLVDIATESEIERNNQARSIRLPKGNNKNADYRESIGGFKTGDFITLKNEMFKRYLVTSIDYYKIKAISVEDVNHYSEINQFSFKPDQCKIYQVNPIEVNALYNRLCRMDNTEEYKRIIEINALSNDIVLTRNSEAYKKLLKY